jgi:hypothetical protein
MISVIENGTMTHQEHLLVANIFPMVTNYQGTMSTTKVKQGKENDFQADVL